MRLKLMFLVVVLWLVTGCSIADKVNNSLNYTEEATSFISNAARLAEQWPALAEKAITDPEARNKLKTELTVMKERILKFNAIEAPAFAKNIHQQLVSYNETLMQEINGYLEKINSGVIDWKSLKDSPLVDTLNQVTQILDRLQNLTP
jgi:benzoyl-CoA reductase/2-hydroxyglutaryl-CoA dehydratase subunit BcrC/BadD/HgdB